MQEKRLVLTWNKEQLDSYDDEYDFVQMCLDEAAKTIGYMAIMNPYESIQWVGNQLKESEENATIQLYVKLNIFPHDNPEYFERTKREDSEDESSEN